MLAIHLVPHCLTSLPTSCNPRPTFAPTLQAAARSDASAQVKARLDATIARLAAEGRAKQ